MALANDNYYGYALKLLVNKHITWLECAAANLVWTTIMVYYLERPHGHLMLEDVTGAQARTAARGNLFSFSLPWEDIEKRCIQASQNWSTAVQEAREYMTLPHREETLACLVNVHIVGGAKNMIEALEGAKMRTGPVLELISALRKTGYAGYAAEHNADHEVRARMKRMYSKKYGKDGKDLPADEFFIPDLIRKASADAHDAKLSGSSLVWDKNATPAEPAKAIMAMEKEMRPLNLVGEQSSNSASTVHEEHGNILARYQKLEVVTGSTMVDQFRPQYLGSAYPFTMPSAVGGYDVPGKNRWRRPLLEDIDVPFLLDDVYFRGERMRKMQVGAAQVKLFDLARSLPRRIEAQYRRHWSFVPGLWNLYFREQVNTGTSLSAVSRASTTQPQDQIEQDAATAAADLYEKLQSGHYITQDGKRRRIDGDMSKLRFAQGVTPEQKRLLADFSFRTKQIAGTQEIRSKIGHVCFWGSVVYGNGIFMTISPGERHNYLAIRLSRYRNRDPYITQGDSAEREWIGTDRPSLQANEGDRFQLPSLEANEHDEIKFEVPGYDLRRLIQARDPLAPALAFAVQVRCVLATLFGIRMCPDCPHCAEGESPCQDAFGSNAEAMGGIAGRSDGLAGAVECQKISGSLHLHFWNYVQRAHQHKTLQEIADLLQQSLITSKQLKRFYENLCCETYPDEAALNERLDSWEKRWPQFNERDDAQPQHTVEWGEHRFGRIPPFVWQDAGQDYSSLHSRNDKEAAYEELKREAQAYQAQFDRALQENMMCAQHHIHKKDPQTGERRIPKPCLSYRDGKNCKHDFPMKNKMNRKEAMLVCKGIAKQRELKMTGVRNMMGCILGRRNNEWLDGTAPGLSIGLSGSNSDVKINDRLPIMTATHEDEHCSKRCVRSCSAKQKKRCAK